MTDKTFSYDTYLSPFTWRYGSEAMHQLWSQAHKRRLWRRVWVALATAQHGSGDARAARDTLARARERARATEDSALSAAASALAEQIEGA